MIGVDVGTGSARAGVFDAAGRCLGRGSAPIAAEPAPARPCRAQLGGHLAGRVRPPSARRWPRPSVDPAAIARHRLRCHLLAGGARRRTGRPLSVSTTGEPRWDTIVWLDHRAVAEAEECTASGHRVLDHVGGVMSPEMEIPKLMWLKRHLPESLGARRPVPRPRRLPDLARQRQHRPLGVHRHLQVDLSRPRDAGLAARTSWPRGASPTCSSAAACPSAPRRSAAISAR